jgi:hypothetical protein
VSVVPQDEAYFERDPTHLRAGISICHLRKVTSLYNMFAIVTFLKNTCFLKYKKKISIEIITTQLSKRYKIFINKIKSRRG